LKDFWFLLEDFFYEDYVYFCMVKYLSFRNSSFCLKMLLFTCKWQGHGVTHPLFHICGVAPQLAICPSHSLAKFGNKYDMKVNKFNVPSHLLASSLEKSDFSFFF